MSTQFLVTDMGLTLNERMLMPGSTLIIKSAPHPSWLDCGHVVGQVTERRLEVASPAPSAGPSLDDVRTKYEQVTGKKPHHKAKAETLLAEIAQHG